jgi:hypothetical protein
MMACLSFLQVMQKSKTTVSSCYWLWDLNGSFHSHQKAMSHGVITPKCTQEEDIWSDTTCWQSAGHLPLGIIGCVGNGLTGTLMQKRFNADSCCVMLSSLQQAITRKCPLLILWWDSFGICLNPYSLPLATSDFNLLHALKGHISPLMNTSHMLLSCGWRNRDKRSTHMG